MNLMQAVVVVLKEGETKRLRRHGLTEPQNQALEAMVCAHGRRSIFGGDLTDSDCVATVATAKALERKGYAVLTGRRIQITEAGRMAHRMTTA